MVDDFLDYISALLPGVAGDGWRRDIRRKGLRSNLPRGG